MKLRLLIINLLIIEIVAENDKQFILDYFQYKKTSTIVGFRCNSLEDDFKFMKDLNQKGITAIIGNSHENLMYNFLNTKYYKLGVYLDLRCHDAFRITKIFTEATLGKLYSELHYWLVLTDNLMNATASLQDDRFGLWTDFVVAVYKRNNSYKLYDVYNPHKARNGKLNVTYLGNWKLETGFNIGLMQSKYTRRINLYGMTWRVSFFGAKYRAKNVSLESHLEDYEKTGKKDGLSKFGYSVMKHLAEMHNASIHINKYSVWRKEDRLGPITRALLYEETDFSGTPINMIAEKLSFVKLVYASWPFRTCFIFRSPQPNVIKVDEVLNPLAVNVWYLYSAMALIFVVILGTTLRFENFEISHLIQWSNSVLITVGCLCQQGTDFKIELISTRIVFLFTMVFSFLIYNYYSASVVSARLNEQIFKLNDSLDSLADTNLEVASEAMIYFDFYMNEMPMRNNKFLKKKWEVLPEDRRFISPEKGMQLVKDGGFAYHTHPDIGYPYINRYYDNREICELTEVHLAMPSLRTIAVGYNSSFYEISKIGFLRMSEVGIRKRQLIRWCSKKPLCRTDIISTSGTTIYEFAPHLILLSIGMMLSLLLFAIEMLIVDSRHHKFEFFMEQKESMIKFLLLVLSAFWKSIKIRLTKL